MDSMFEDDAQQPAPQGRKLTNEEAKTHRRAMLASMEEVERKFAELRQRVEQGLHIINTGKARREAGMWDEDEPREFAQVQRMVARLSQEAEGLRIVHQIKTLQVKALDLYYPFATIVVPDYL